MPQVKKLEKLKKAADLMSTVVEAIARDPEQFYDVRDARKVKDKLETVQTSKKADIKAVRDLILAMKTLTELVRDLNGLGAGEAEERSTGVILMPETREK